VTTAARPAGRSHFPAPHPDAGAPAPRPAPPAAAVPRPARVALLGASGYSGLEFARLALAHPGLTLAALVSREHAGRPGTDLLPGHAGGGALPAVIAPEAVEGLLAAGDADTVVACLPHGAWAALVEAQPRLESLPGRVVDLSADRRDGSRGYVYGLPEADRAAVASAARVANPGCYPTAAALALLPALAAGWVRGPVFVGALSGASGAGRGAALRTSFVELDGGAALYRAGSEHPHAREMERSFTRLGEAPCRVSFAPQLVPMARGILLTAHAPLSHPVSPGEAHHAYCERYAAEPFVRVLDPGAWPETRAVRGSNRCDVAVTTLHGGETLLAAAAIDNLVKGAAGQALQNLNLLLGWPETTALPAHGSPW